MTSLDLTTDEAIAETKKGSGVAEENVAGFPSDETRTVVPENSLHIEKGRNATDYFQLSLTLYILITFMQFLAPEHLTEIYLLVLLVLSLG